MKARHITENTETTTGVGGLTGEMGGAHHPVVTSPHPHREVVADWSEAVALAVGRLAVRAAGASNNPVLRRRRQATGDVGWRLQGGGPGRRTSHVARRTWGDDDFQQMVAGSGAASSRPRQILFLIYESFAAASFSYKI